jgi:hypothetical protein
MARIAPLTPPYSLLTLTPVDFLISLENSGQNERRARKSVSRTSQRVETRQLPLEPLPAAAQPVRDAPRSAPTRVLRRRRFSPRYWVFRIRVGWRRRRLNGDAALLVLCFVLFLATIGAAVSVVVQAR